MFGADKADDKQLRSVAKMINYGIVYGLSDFGLAQRLGIERADAKRYIEGYLKTYAVARQVHGPASSRTPTATAARARCSAASAPSPSCRRATAAALGRRAHGAQHADPGHGGRPPEAGDDRGAARASTRDARDVKMLLTVHDELVLEAPADEADAVGKQLVDKMEGVAKLDVPLKVDLGIGKNWAEAK